MTSGRLTTDLAYESAQAAGQGQSFGNQGFNNLGVTSFDLADMLGVVWRRKFLILLVGVVGGAVAFAVATQLTPKYTAAGELVVRSDALTSPETDRAFDSSVVNDAVVTTEQQILTSTGLLTRVADSLTIPPALMGQKSLRERLVELSEQLAGVAGPAAAARVHAFWQQVTPAAPAGDPSLAQAQARLQFIASTITVGGTKGSSVLSVQATTPDAKFSADIVNHLLNVYMQQRSAEQDRVAHLIETALRERLRQVRQQIAQGEDDLVRLLQQPGAIEGSEVPDTMRDMTLLGMQLTQAQTDLARREADYNAALASMHGGGALPESQTGSTVELRRELLELQQYLARSADQGPNYPQRQAAQRQVNALQSQLAAETSRGLEQRRNDVATARATVAALQASMDSKRQNRQAESATTIGLQRQREAVASLWRISDTLETRLIDLAAHPSNPNASVLSYATPPSLAASPNKALIAAAGFLAGAIITVAALLIRVHRRRLRPMAIHIARQLSVPLLGGLPQMIGLRSGQRRLIGSALGGQSRDGLAETLRGVALELEDAIVQGSIGCLMVTSGYVGEGKTTVATALARALASMSMRVLLIDLDLRSPSVERVFQGAAPGALEPAEQRIGPQNVLQIKRDRASGLHILTPFADGLEDPAVQLRSSDLRETVALARGAYDVVMFDTPAVMAVPDALEVARHADAIVLITELGRSSEQESAELSRRLARTRKPVCGVIVTKVEPGDARAGAYTGYVRRPVPRLTLALGDATRSSQAADL